MSAEYYNISDELLVKYLLGEASSGEREEVEKWLDASPENQRYYQHFKYIWDESREIAAKSTVDENDAWRRFRQRVSGEPATPVMTVVKPARTKWYDTRVAAAVIMLAGAAALLFFILNPYTSHKEVVLAAQNRALAETLPDGSVVTLNKRSSISFAEAFNGKSRAVKLVGEAFFQVKNDQSRPFIVTVNDITITVLGTSFNVKTADGKTEVIVESGMVKVERAEQSVQLKQKEKLEISNTDSVLVKEALSDQFYKYYRTKEFVCDETPLWKLTEAINEAYNVNIIIENPALKNYVITTTFYNETVDRMLELITITYPEINIEKRDSLIILK